MIARLSTVYLRATGRTTTGVPHETVATGFFVNERGNILTVNHLVTDLGDVDPEVHKNRGSSWQQERQRFDRLDLRRET